MLRKKVICADGKLLKCPEGSNSSVLVKTGRISHRLTHRCLEHSESEAGSAVPKHGSALLKQMPLVCAGNMQALSLVMSK